MTTAGSTHTKEKKHSTVSILGALSDDKSLDLFKIIASVYPIEGGELINTQLLISKVKLTRKQYYSRISALISSGLVKRSNGKYLLTSLGKVAYSVTALIDQAIHDHWKLKAVDALETKSSSGIPDEEREKIVDMLVDNHELKRILSAQGSLYNETEKQMSSADKRSAPAIARHHVPMRINQILE